MHSLGNVEDGGGIALVRCAGRSEGADLDTVHQHFEVLSRRFILALGRQVIRYEPGLQPVIVWLNEPVS